MSLTLTHEVHRIPFRDPFRIARTARLGRRPASTTTVIVELRSDRPPGHRRRTARGSPTPTTARPRRRSAAVLPRLLAAVEPLEDRWPSASRRSAERWTDVGRRDGRPRSPTTARPSAPSTSPSTTWSASVLGIPVHELLGLSADIPPTDFTIGIDEPAIVAERAARAAHFPALKIKLGGPADLETLAAVRAVYGGPIRVDANTGWTLDGRQAAAARARPPRGRAHRAAVPGPPARRPGGAPGRVAAADRRRRERGHDRRPRRARRGRRRGQRQAGEVRRRRARRPGCWPGRASSASGRSSAAWRRRRSGSRPRRPSRRSPTGSTSTAACSSPADPFEGLELGDDCRWRLTDRPGLGVEPAGLSGACRRTPLSVERPFVWISWWTRWWTNPLPPSGGGSYHGGPTASDPPGEGSPGPREHAVGPPASAVERALEPRERRETVSHGFQQARSRRRACRRTRSSSSASATGAGGSAGRSCTTRCARSPVAGSTAAGGSPSSRSTGSGSASTRRSSWPGSPARSRRGG